jgi:hypothetical protein
MNSRVGRLMAVLASGALISACGGGGGDDGGGGNGAPNPPTSAEGLWTGTSSNGRTIAGLVLDTGEYWFIYTLAGNNAVIGGAAQGNGTSTNGKFTSSNGKDFNFEGLGVNNVDVSADYVQKSTLNGRLDYGSEVVTFTSNYDSDYERAPSLTELAGTFSGSGYAGLTEFTMVTIAASGALTGQSASGCTFSGNASPRSKGNVYNVTVTFNGGPCANGTNTVSGVGYYDASMKQLISAALNSGRTNGFIFVGTKP